MTSTRTAATPTAAAAVAGLLAPEPTVAAHPAVVAAQRIARDHLAPHAADADDPAHGVDPHHLDLHARSGLQGVTLPVAEGGLGAPDRVLAEVVELTSGACGATWFVTTQHGLPQQLTRGPLPGLDPSSITLGPAAPRDRTALATASARAGIALSHIRRTGPPAVRAAPDGTGWRFDGNADWCTGWGLIDVVMIAGTTPDGRFVMALLPAVEQPGLRAGAPLPLAVMGGTRTVALQIDGLRVAAADVLAVVDAATWLAHDVARTANTTPAALGLLRRVLVALAELGERRDRPEAVDAALVLAQRAATLRTEVYDVARQPMFEHVPERTALRGEVTELTVRSANALIAARSGSAMLTASPEQRWAREAAFHLVQAQTAEVRVAQLARFAFVRR